LRRLPVDWNAPADNDDFTAPAQLQFVVHEAEEELLFDWVTQTARHAGTLVHRELQRLTRMRSQKPFDPATHRARYLFELAELGVPLDHRGATVDRVIAALTRTLADERGQWILQSRAANFEAASELALSGVVNGEVVSIVIDRTFVDDVGARWIVDYKTSTHEGGDLEEFLASEVLRYTPQLARYAQLMRSYKADLPIRTALYFTMLGVWREVALN
jgi:ATP-dependent helicase/nuclease subunit A